MQNSHTKADMTQGPAMKLVLLFALPICIGNILQQLYTTVDTLVIGNFCDSVSLAAVGTSSQPVEMLLCIFLGIGTGVSILISQYTGSGDGKAVRETAATATSFLYLSAIPISILGLFLGPLILKFMQVPEDTWDLAVSYLRIIFLGTLGNMGYNMNAGILRGMGDSRASLFFLLISCFTNIVLDLLFIAGFQMDVTGAALATSLSMFASWLFSVIYIRRKYPELEFTLLPKKLNKNILRRIITVGLPLGLNNSIYSVGHIFLQALVNAQGSTFMAAFCGHHLFRPELRRSEICPAAEGGAADSSVLRVDYLHSRCGRDLFLPSASGFFHQRRTGAGACRALYQGSASLHVDIRSV